MDPHTYSLWWQNPSLKSPSTQAKYPVPLPLLQFCFLLSFQKSWQLHTTIQNPLLRVLSPSQSPITLSPNLLLILEPFSPSLPSSSSLRSLEAEPSAMVRPASRKKALKRAIQQDPSPNSQSQTTPPSSAPSSPFSTNDETFEKELLGLTGGFLGGEKGLKKFIQENPPPKKTNLGDEEVGIVFQGSKPRAPDLPLFLPGMIVIVKNPNNLYHMYCGIVQRVTDGKAGVLLEGGKWDRLITFKLDELKRREKGTPMVNPKFCVLESIVEQSA